MRYSLAGSTAPLAVAGYTYDALPPAVRDAVPTDAELSTALGAAPEPQNQPAPEPPTEDGR